jgi:hypothetical protein
VKVALSILTDKIVHRLLRKIHTLLKMEHVSFLQLALCLAGSQVLVLSAYAPQQEGCLSSDGKTIEYPTKWEAVSFLQDFAYLQSTGMVRNTCSIFH